MGGLFGFGLGLGLAWATVHGGQVGNPVVGMGLVALAFWLVYRAGRRRGGAAVASAVAVATARATSSSSATGGQAVAGVQVFIGQGEAAGRQWRDLDGAAWRVPDEGAAMLSPADRLALDHSRAVSELENVDLDPEDIDPVELVERIASPARQLPVDGEVRQR